MCKYGTIYVEIVDYRYIFKWFLITNFVTTSCAQLNIRSDACSIDNFIVIPLNNKFYIILYETNTVQTVDDRNVGRNCKKSGKDEELISGLYFPEAIAFEGVTNSKIAIESEDGRYIYR